MCAYDTTLLDVTRPPQLQSISMGRWREVPHVAWLPALTRGAMATVIALAGIYLATSFYRLNHTDLWGHLSFGRWIVENGQLPSTDPWRDFGSSDHFVNVPWLGQVLGDLWYQTAGAEGLALAHVVLVTLTFGLLLAAIRGQGLSAGWGVAGAIAGYVLAIPVVGTIRPQLFGGVAFGLVLLGLSQLPRRRAPLVWLPIVFVCWANLHGSVIVGLVTIGCVAIGKLWEVTHATGGLRRAWIDPELRHLALLFVLAVAGTCLNPAGPRLLVEAAEFSGNLNLDAITEWRPLVIGSLSGGLFFSSIVITALLLRFSPRPVRLHEILLVLVFGLGTLSALRMLFWWAIVWPWIASPHAAAAWTAWRHAAAAKDEATTTRTLIAMLVAFLALVWAPPSFGFIVGQPRSEAQLVDHDTPFYVAQEITRRGLEGRVFAPMDWADYLVWQTHGTVQPLVHSHVHLVSNEAWEDYKLLTDVGPGWLNVIDHYGLRYVVAHGSSKLGLSKLVRSSPRLRVVYQDQQAILFEVLPDTKTSDEKKVTSSDALRKLNTRPTIDSNCLVAETR